VDHFHDVIQLVGSDTDENHTARPRTRDEFGDDRSCTRVNTVPTSTTKVVLNSTPARTEP
jgi:hypothetical protein